MSYFESEIWLYNILHTISGPTVGQNENHISINLSNQQKDYHPILHSLVNLSSQWTLEIVWKPPFLSTVNSMNNSIMMECHCGPVA